MMNPIGKIMEDKDMDLRGLAAWLNVGYHQLWETFRGYPKDVPRGLLQALAAKGYDAHQIATDYRMWRASIVERR